MGESKQCTLARVGAPLGLKPRDPRGKGRFTLSIDEIDVLVVWFHHHGY